MSLDIAVQRTAMRGLLALPRPVRRLLAGPQIVRDGQLLDLNAQLLARIDHKMGGALGSNGGSPRQARAGMRRGSLSVAGPRIPMKLEQHELVAGAEGVLSARRYVPDVASPSEALIVYYHGGGWVVGDLDTHDAPCRALAVATGMTVISVDYRLAPEHPFPAPVDDAFAAFQDIASRAAEFGADPGQVVVAGDSAGGHLATMVAQRAAQHGATEPAAQILVYPVCDFTRTYESERAFAEGFFLTKANMDFFTEHFLVSDADQEAASPIHGQLAGLPPALVLTAGFDPLRDEGEAYAAALRDAGVTVMLHRVESQVHGFFNMHGVGTAAHEAVGEVAGVLRAWGVGAAAAAPVATAR